jgi:ABC-type transport system involved in multi-copper enzyme maturation permease subunit
MINYVVLAAALLLSVVSAFYSVVGLTTLFSGAFWSIVVLGVMLEACKVVSVSWLNSNWKTSPIMIKTYLIFAVVILMIITSMGTFGYLSKAHLQNQNTSETSMIQVQQLQSKVDNEKRIVANSQRSLNQLDTVSELNVKDNVVRNRQKRERAVLNNNIQTSLANIDKINEQLLPLQVTAQKTKSELGPLLYIAEMFYGKDGQANFDKTVRGLILMIVSVFDPLAIILLMSANHGFSLRKKPEIDIEKPTDVTIIENKRAFVFDDQPNDIIRRRAPLTKIRCQHCKKQVSPGPFARFHGDKCKENNDRPFFEN